MPNEVRRASARLAGLRAYGHTPDPATEARAYQELGYQRLQREVRVYRENVPSLDPARVGHLVGLLVEGSDPEAVDRLERAVREAVYGVRLTDDDRARLAAIITDGMTQ